MRQWNAMKHRKTITRTKKGLLSVIRVSLLTSAVLFLLKWVKVDNYVKQTATSQRLGITSECRLGLSIVNHACECVPWCKHPYAVNRGLCFRLVFLPAGTFKTEAFLNKPSNKSMERNKNTICKMKLT